MKMKYLVLIYFVLVDLTVVFCDKNENDEKFIATHKWQSIKKGQKVTSRLHYRINAKTDLIEAKLLDEDTENTSKRTKVLDILSENESTIEDLKQILKKIKNDDTKPGVKMKSNFRTYEQIKEELGSLNLTSKVDAEIIKDLLKQHRNEMAKGKVDVKIILNIVDDFDYLGHQFDNGLEFVRQNGFRDVIYKNLNSSHEIIKQNTLKLLGSLVQNNARVQIHALETGSVPILLRFVSSDSSELTKSNSVFAMSGILRRFPLAQKKFLESGGVFVVSQVFEKASIKIQLKIVTLMTDLFSEKRHAVENSVAVLLNQYNNIPLETELLAQDWCFHLNKLLFDIVNSYQDDHDSIEKCLIAMELVKDKCRNFNRDLLTRLKDKYKIFAIDETYEDDFFTNIVLLCSNILSYTKEKSEL